MVALGMLPAYNARAWTCCDPWGWVGYAAFIQAGSAMVVSITTAVSTLVNVIELQIEPSWGNGFGKQMAELQKQTASQKVFRQGAVAVQSQFYMQERAGEAAERAVMPAQQSLTVTNALLMAEQGSIVRQKIAKADMEFVAGIYSAKSLNPVEVAERHKIYCSAFDQARGRCDTVAAPTMQNADLTVNTVLNPGDGQYETLADEERDAAVAFVRNVVSPVAEARLSAQQYNSEQAKALDAALLSDQAALSVAAHSFNAMIAHRTRRHQQ